MHARQQRTRPSRCTASSLAPLPRCSPSSRCRGPRVLVETSLPPGLFSWRCRRPPASILPSPLVCSGGTASLVVCASTTNQQGPMRSTHACMPTVSASQNCVRGVVPRAWVLRSMARACNVVPRQPAQRAWGAHHAQARHGHVSVTRNTMHARYSQSAQARDRGRSMQRARDGACTRRSSASADTPLARLRPRPLPRGPPPLPRAQDAPAWSCWCILFFVRTGGPCGNLPS